MRLTSEIGDRISPGRNSPLAIRSPAFVSAPSKRSFSNVNCPIFACSVFTSPPKTPAAPSRSWLFHCVIWLACTSNCRANSKSAFSPFYAAKATFALNAAVWFRRGHLPVQSPLSSHIRPVQTRFSTYPRVQFSRATSCVYRSSGLPNPDCRKQALHSPPARLDPYPNFLRNSFCHPRQVASSKSF